MFRFPSSSHISPRAPGPDNLKNNYKVLRRLIDENLSLIRELEELRALRRLAHPAPRKGLRNRRLFARRLADELVRSERDATRQGSLLLMAVNDINLVNELHGRDAGEAVVREIINVTRGVLDTPDVLCRTSGAEFMALLPEADARDARLVMAKLRAAVIRISARRNLSISISVVSASWPADGVGVAALCRKVERAMQLEKRSLRGRARRRPPRPNGGRTLTGGKLTSHKLALVE
jgi:diguanylate cyclase (GGDEF)-like protein